MMKRTLPGSGIEVSALAFGCWIGGSFWPGDAPDGWAKVDDEEFV